MRQTWFAFLGILLCGLAGCDTLPISAMPASTPEAAYTAEHPYYFEFCALSELQKKPGYGADIRGGIGGHSVIYLNGACLDGDGYPTLTMCATDPGAHGVGLSINAHFANANWVAIPGRDFFFHGDLKPGQALTRAGYDETKAHAKRMGFYDAIKFHDDVFDDMPAGYTRDAYKYEVSIATDYAIGYGRDRYCARVPVSAAEMARIVAYLNGLNEPYRDGKATYEWNVFNDNCVHVAHNALAAIGFWAPWPTHMPLILAVFDFPVPKNEFVNIMRRANDMRIDDPLTVWNDTAARQTLLDGGQLPRRPGALATFEAATPVNAVYNTNDLSLIFYDDPYIGSYEGWYRQIATDARYTDMAADQEAFRKLYANIENHRRPLSWWLKTHSLLRAKRDFPRFYARFYDAIQHEAERVGTARSQMAGLGD